MTSVGSYDLGAVRVGSEASHSSGSPSPAPPEGALALLSGSGITVQEQTAGPSGSGGPSGNRVVRLDVAPGLYSSLGPLVQKERRKGS